MEQVFINFLVIFSFLLFFSTLVQKKRVEFTASDSYNKSRRIF